MRVLAQVLVVMTVLGMLAGCAKWLKQERRSILCPACGTEFEPIYQKSF